MLGHPYPLVVDQRRVSHPRAERHLHLGDVSGVDQGLDETHWKENETTDARGSATALPFGCTRNAHAKHTAGLCWLCGKPRSLLPS